MDDLDARIAALEAELAAEGPSSDEEEAFIPPLPTHLLPEFYTQAATAGRGGAQAEPPPLPRTAKKKRRKAEAGASAEAAVPGADNDGSDDARPLCAACGLRFSGPAQLAEHEAGRKHLKKVAEAAGDGAAAQPAPRRAPPPRGGPPPPLAGPSCALCCKEFTSEAQLAEHQSGKWHVARLRGELPPATSKRRRADG